MKLKFLSIALFTLFFTLGNSQTNVNSNTLVDCDKVCEVEKIIQEGALLGVKITNYQKGKGAYVLKVLDKTAAKKYSFSSKDVILSVDNVEVTGMKHLVKMIQAHQPSDLVNITYLRGDETFNIDVVLGAKKTRKIVVQVCCDDNDEYFNDYNIVLFPNPTVSSISVEMNEAEKGKYVFQVFNIQGERVFSQAKDFTGRFTNNIDVSNIPAGEYFLMVSKGKASFSKSFIKQD